MARFPAETQPGVRALPSSPWASPPPGQQALLRRCSPPCSPSPSYLSRGLSVKAEDLPQLLLADGLWSVDFVAQDEDWHVGYCLICHEGLRARQTSQAAPIASLSSAAKQGLLFGATALPWVGFFPKVWRKKAAAKHGGCFQHRLKDPTVRAPSLLHPLHQRSPRWTPPVQEAHWEGKSKAQAKPQKRRDLSHLATRG